MAWFNYLKEQGFFNPSNNPHPVLVGDGFQISSWEPLDYLEKVASTFKDGENKELIPDILEIIKNVSEYPVDNYRTWYRLIRILSMIPNQLVPIEFLDYIPTWVNSRFDTMLQTSEITKFLLPKFLTNQSNLDDIKKAEKILYYFFQIKIAEVSDPLDGSGKVNYRSPFYLYQLSQSFHDEQLLEKIVDVCSLKPLYELLDTINVLLRNHEILMQENIDGFIYDFKISRVFHTLNFIIEKSVKEEKQILVNLTKENYFDMDAEDFHDLLKDIFNKHHIDQQIFVKVYERLNFNLANDLNSIFGYNGIIDLDDETSHDNKTLDTFSYLLREWLTQFVKKDKKSANQVLEDFLIKPAFNLPYFKRMFLYAVAQDWDGLKPLFWKLVDKDDTNNVFSTDAYKLEVFYLLNAISSSLDMDDQLRFSKIIEHGPQGERHYTESKAAWQHRWLDALKENVYFKDNFNRLSQEHKFKNDYSREGKVTVRVGHVSPFSVEQILELSDQELVSQVLNFKNRDRWDDPTVEGFADCLGKAVEEEPQRFSRTILGFGGASYLYVYQMLYGFSNAWKANKDFNWASVLSFCESYICSEPFIKDLLKTDDDLRANKDWIFENVAYLITTGAQFEEHSFPNELLPLAKRILIRMTDELLPAFPKNQDNPDFVMHSLNSTGGKVLRALLDYSLKCARNLAVENVGDCWDVEAKAAFSDAIDRKVIDGYTLIGMHLSQFMYLDDTWLREQVIKGQQLDMIYWMALMGGIGFGIPVSLDFYKLMYPSYQRVIDTGKIDMHYHQGILRHFLAFYFWDYENAFEKTFLYQVLQTADAKLIHQLISLLMKQKKSIKYEKDANRNRLTQKVLEIWKLINIRIGKLSEKEDLKLVSNVMYLMDYIQVLNNDNVLLVTANMSSFNNEVANVHLMKTLLQWSVNSPAELIAKIAAQFKIGLIYESGPLLELVRFLYENNQTDTANQMANKVAMEGYDFLRPLYQQFNT